MRLLRHPALSLTTMMTIQLNGQPHPVPAACSLQQLVERLGLTGRRLAIEVNGEIIPRSAHADALLHDGDRVEIVQAIGGG